MTGEVFSRKKYAKKARQAVAEGIVLIRNEESVLPLAPESRIALFGRSQFSYYKSGTGSGGAVNAAYVTGILEALEEDGRYPLNQTLKKCYEEWLVDHPFDMGNGWAQEPWFQEEMPLTEELVRKTKEESDTAVIIIGRTAGEDKDNRKEEGSFLLTKTEEEMLETVCRIYDRTIVLLNVGNIMDMNWVEKYQPKAVLYVWQGGQEGGNGVLDVLDGDVCPCGRLSDTIAYDIEDYPSTKNYGDADRNIYAEDIYVGYRYFSTFAPEKVLYPFGYGLSYTDFDVTTRNLTVSDETDKQDAVITLQIEVKNVGNLAGKEVVQVYCEAPQGELGKAARSLCGYGKTRELAPGESQILKMIIPREYLASYDDAGLTGHKSCYVMEAGEYIFYVGKNVRDAGKAGSISLSDTIVVKQLEEALAPVVAFSYLVPGEKKPDGTREPVYRNASLRTVDPAKRRLDRLPQGFAYTGDKGYRLTDVETGAVSMGEFLAQLTDEELCCIIRGEGMCSPKVTPGTAGAFGGVTEALLKYGIPIGCCADGPSGIRMDCGTTAFSMPNGTCLACTFNGELVQELYEWEGLELRKNKVDTILGPGMNIHRNPLNGRNFEYFSEDPFLTGKIAAAQLKGMHKYGVTGTIKHFACNNQEFRRNFVDAVVTERALREIYLKGFEIAVKEGNARSIMSTYGPVNGLWTASSYDLLTTVLRGEWGFTGIVMTDWWAKGNDEGEEATIKNSAAMVRSQNDICMVTGDSLTNANGDNSEEGLKRGTVTRGEFQRSAANICRFLMQSPAFLRSKGEETELDKQLKKCVEQEETATGHLLKVKIENGVAYVDPTEIDTAKGKRVTLEVTGERKCTYRMELTCRASADSPELAQMPVSVFQDRMLLDTISLNGTEKEWTIKTVEFTGPDLWDTFFIKLYFGMSGIEIKELKIILIAS